MKISPQKDNDSKQSVISIGMPVYNGSLYIRHALDSILSQDFPYFKLIISDNASSDNTQEICMEYCSIDKRIIYYRQKINIGAAENFYFVFKNSGDSEYFMWAACDDIFEKKYIASCIKMLQRKPEAVLCTSDVSFIDDLGRKRDDLLPLDRINRNTIGLPILDRIEKLVSHMGWYEIYGVIRRNRLDQIDLVKYISKHGGDVLILAHLSLLGEFAKINDFLWYYRIHTQQESLRDAKNINFIYSELIRNIYKIFSSANMDEIFKLKAKNCIINALTTKNSEWFNYIAKEQFGDIASSNSIPVELHGFFIEEIVSGKWFRRIFSRTEKKKFITYLYKEMKDRFFIEKTKMDKELLTSCSRKVALLLDMPWIYPPRFASNKRSLLTIDILKKLGYNVVVLSCSLFQAPYWTITSMKLAEIEIGVRILLYFSGKIDKYYFTKNKSAILTYCLTPGFRIFLIKNIKKISPEIFWCNYAYLGGVVNVVPKKCITIIDSIDILSLNQGMAHAISVAAKIFLVKGKYRIPEYNEDVVRDDFFNNIKIVPDEKEFKIYDNFDITLAISKKEEMILRQKTKKTLLQFIPFCFDKAFDATDDSRKEYVSPPLFVIGPNYFNIQGYLYIASKVLPIILSCVPNFRLRVVGDCCKKLFPVDGIELMGFVDDIQELYRTSKFAICPMLGGTGQQLKVLEAMANGLPVIIHENIKENVCVIHNVNGYIAKNPEEFKKYMILLYKNQELCRILGRSARNTVKEIYSKVIIENNLAKVINCKSINSKHYKNHSDGYVLIYCNALLRYAVNVISQTIFDNFPIKLSRDNSVRVCFQYNNEK